MKNPLLMVVLLFSFFSQHSIAQEANVIPEKFTAHNKGKFYFFWGGNRESYSKSDINFTGKDYNFTIYDVEAHDRPKGWHIDYFNPARMTIPQTNFRMGYYITDKYNISVGVDHMKYIMTQDQTVNMNGYINMPSSEPGSVYNGVYTNVPQTMTYNFLTFEHTDGLNYVNAEISRVDDVSKIFTIGNTDKIQINITEGIGGGVLYPKTNAKVLEKRRHDDFHISGYGVAAKAGLNITFFKYFFTQLELKGGYINMNDIRTTYEGNDRASQEFFFLQRIVSFGGIFKI